MAKPEIHQKRIQEQTQNLIKNYTKQITELQARIADLERQLYGGNTPGSQSKPLLGNQQMPSSFLPMGNQRSF